MPLKYTDEHEIFRRSLRKFFEAEVKPNVEQWRKQGFIPREIWKKMGGVRRLFRAGGRLWRRRGSNHYRSAAGR